MHTCTDTPTYIHTPKHTHILAHRNEYYGDEEEDRFQDITPQPNTKNKSSTLDSTSTPPDITTMDTTASVIPASEAAVVAPEVVEVVAAAKSRKRASNKTLVDLLTVFSRFQHPKSAFLNKKFVCSIRVY